LAVNRPDDDDDKASRRTNDGRKEHETIATHPQHGEEEGDKEEEGSMAHTAPRCHQEKLLLGHLTHRSVKPQKDDITVPTSWPELRTSRDASR